MSTKQCAPLVVILAGGMGKRLRPLTSTVPKPLLPVLGKPLIFHILRKLEGMGIEQAYLMTGYLADKLENAIAGYDGKLKPICVREHTPMGSAGCFGLIDGVSEWNECIVVSGDAYFEFDLMEAVSLLREKEAAAVMCLSEVEHPQGLGLVQCDKEGRICDFEEKPTWSGVRGNLVNTGIYVLGREAIELIISQKKPMDFGKDVFPSLLEKKKALYGLHTQGYWCDVGTPESYRQCNMRLSGADTVLGNGVKLASTANLKQSVLLDGVQVGAGATVTGAVIGENVIIGQGVSISKAAVIGASAVIGDRSRIGEGVTLPAGTIVASRSVLQADLCMGVQGNFAEGKLFLYPADVCRCGNRAGKALAALAGQGRRVGVMRPMKKGRGEFWKGFVEGILSYGCDVLDLGWGFAAKASFASKSLDLKYTALVAEDGERIEISFFDGDGLYPNAEFERSFSDCINELPAETEREGRMILYKDLEKNYLSALCAEANGNCLRGLSVKVQKAESGCEEILADALTKRGAEISERAELIFTLNEEGTRVWVSVFGMRVDYWQLYAILALEQIKRDGLVFLPYCCPEYIKKTVCSAGGKAVYYSLFPSGKKEEHIRSRMTRQQPFACDGLFAAMRFAVLVCRGSLRASYLSDICRAMAVQEEDFSLAEKEKLKAILCYRQDFDGEGIYRRYKQGGVRLRACADDRIHLMAEAADEMDAKLLIEKIKKEISSLDA